MGETRTLFKIYGMNGKAAELEALVDTGATFTKIPGTVAKELGLGVKYETEVELAGSGQVKGGLTLAEVEQVKFASRRREEYYRSRAPEPYDKE